MVVASEMTAPPMPPYVDCHLEAIQSHSDGGLLLVSSNLVNRYWTGSLWYFKNAMSAPNYQCLTAAAQARTGVKDARWISDMKMASIGDDGGVYVYDICTKDQTFNTVFCRCEHDNFCTALDVNTDKTWVISSSYDGCIKVWDLTEMYALYTFRGHSDTVFSLSTHPTQPDTFLSCSKDGNCILWDTRTSRPAKRLGIVKDSVPVSVCWQPKSENSFVVGDENGEIRSIDLREPGKALSSVKVHDRPITRMEFSPTNTKLLATGSEDCNVVVTDLTQGSLVYKRGHNDFVTGVTWSPEGSKLYSCGWDSSVKCHDIAANLCTECGTSVCTESGGTTTAMEVNSSEVNGEVAATNMDSTESAAVGTS